ncbi:hypothetical protein CKJ76_25775 [Mycobacterium avium]|nr:hypothetical protein CKJ76_25775 [Mycobacterium avium]
MTSRHDDTAIAVSSLSRVWTSTRLAPSAATTHSEWAHRHMDRDHLASMDVPVERDRIVAKRDRALHGKIVWVENWAETDLAWELASWATERIPGCESSALYITIGIGDAYAAISMLLDSIAHARAPVPQQLMTRIGAWLDAYAHDTDARRLRELLNVMQTFGPTC